MDEIIKALAEKGFKAKLNIPDELIFDQTYTAEEMREIESIIISDNYKRNVTGLCLQH